MPDAAGTETAADARLERFLEVVHDVTGLGPSAAESAARAVLQTLAERISAGEARDLAERLGPELGPWIATKTPAEGFDADEFVRRIAEREDVDTETAERHARATMLALSQVVGADEYDDMVAELPSSFERLLARGEWLEAMPAEEFLARVSRRAGLERGAARAATAAVLEKLAERIAHGEVEDLIDQLPSELHEPLRRGDELSNGAARRIDLDRFVRGVAEREGVDPQLAREHVRAVFATLREAVTPKEWFDVTSQLPAEFAAVSARP
ncbi:MAG: hypothetical protein JWM60_606 [Solirubrobacterales bacterium]|nr:hypothetical protein [Solirubrobacterales bacterium]